jgi:predicted ATP-binding protein involved in virulence
MKIKALTLTHFRCFEHLEVEFEQDITVITAPNGAGKTATLEALTVALGSYLTALPQTKGINFKDADFQVFADDQQANQVMVKANTFDNIRWSKQKTNKTLGNIRSDKTLINIGEKQIRSFVQQLIETDAPDKQCFPIVAYYPDSRFSSSNSAKIPYTQQRIDWHEGYKNALDVKMNFKHLVLQLASLEDAQRRTREAQKSFEYQSTAIQAIKKVLAIALPEVTNLRTILKDQIILVADFDDGKGQKTLDINQLSAGYQAFLALLLDITFRLIALNRENEKCLEGEGIVMIDEIDLHLHPLWQQQCIGKLRKAFPNIQFIVTTHSPQVLSTVKRTAIRVLGDNINGEAVCTMPLANSYGEPSNDILQAIMAVDPQPPVPEKVDLQRLTELVDQGMYDSGEAQNLLSKLKQQLNPTHPQICRIERSIKRQKVLQA